MLTAKEYATLAPMVDANQAAIRADHTAPRPFPAIGNEETGKVEHYRIWHELPETFGAYISCDGKSVTVWTGEILGTSDWRYHSTWRNNFGAHCEAGRVTINGAQYAWRGPGKGMYCTCRKLKARNA